MIGNLLLSPQRLRRTRRGSGLQTLADDVPSLIALVLADRARGGPIPGVLAEALEATANRLREQAEDGLEAAQQALRQELSDVIDGLAALGGELPDIDQPARLVELLERLVSGLTGWIEGFSADVLRPRVTRIAQILEDDLGLTPALFMDQIGRLLDDVAERLEALPDGPGSDDARRMAAILRRVKRHLDGELSGLGLDRLGPRTLADFLVEEARRLDLDTLGRQITCYGEALSALLRVGVEVLELVPTRGAGSVGAAASPGECYCWYASWLLGDDVVIDETRTRIVKRPKVGDEEVLLEGTDLDWPQLFDRDHGRYYTFDTASAEAMEKWAFHLAWVRDVLEGVFHLLSLEPKDWASNSVNAAVQTFAAIWKGAAKEPAPWWLVLFIGRIAGTFGASFEDLHTKGSAGNGFLHWLFVLISTDAYEAFALWGTAGTVQDLILSMLTLLNHDDDARDTAGERPRNVREIDGVADFVVTLTLSVGLVKLIPRKDYAQPFQDGVWAAKMWAGWHLAGSIVAGALGGFVGALLASLFALAVDWRVVGEKTGWSMLRVYGFFWPSLFMDKEGNTNDGKYNPQGNDFPGYPSPSESPYKLPWEKGKTVLCAQGNQGFWSHHDRGGITTVYSYDFSLDAGEEVLAMRPGTVVDYFDWVADDTDPDTAQANAAAAEAAASGVLVPGQSTRDTWNFIVIRHDADNDGNAAAPDPVHDRRTAGTQTVTYAMYGHGRKNSVREAFAARSPAVAANAIIGQKVKRGQVIMKAGDTGRSAYNHLHVDIRTGPPVSAAPPIDRTRLSLDTLPFVFREVKGRFELKYFPTFVSRDGVPMAFNAHGSDNEKVT